MKSESKLQNMNLILEKRGEEKRKEMLTSDRN